MIPHAIPFKTSSFFEEWRVSIDRVL
jgi:hypothetical protein